MKSIFIIIFFSINNLILGQSERTNNKKEKSANTYANAISYVNNSDSLFAKTIGFYMDTTSANFIIIDSSSKSGKSNYHSENKFIKAKSKK